MNCISRFAHWENKQTLHGPVTEVEYCKWDCGWYDRIEHSGYDSAQLQSQWTSWHFLPVFPLTVAPFVRLFHAHSGRATAVMSTVFLFTAILAFVSLLGAEVSNFAELFMAATLVAFNPYLIYAHAGYSEPLYFTLAACALAALKRKRWLLSGVAGGLLSATRLQGVAFVVAYFLGCLRTFGVRGLLRQRDLNVWLGLLLCPAGLSLYLLYLYHLMGDALAPMHSFVAWGVQSGNPIRLVLENLHRGGWSRYWAQTAIAGILVSLWLAWKREFEMAAFLALCIIMPATAEMAGMPRFFWWQPPTLYAIYKGLRRYPNLRMIYACGSGGLAALMVYLWMTGSWNIV